MELRRAGKSAFFIHHAGKNGSQRGTSKREDVLDSVLLLKRPDDYDASQGARFIVQYDKSRGFTGADAAPFEAALDPHTGLWSVKSVCDTRDSEIRELKAAGLSQRQIAKELSVGVATVNRVLNKPVQRLNGHDE